MDVRSIEALVCQQPEQAQRIGDYNYLNNQDKYLIPIFLLNYYIDPEVWKAYVDLDRATTNIFKWCSKRRWTREDGQVIVYDPRKRTGVKYRLSPECRVYLTSSDVILPSCKQVSENYLQARSDLRAHRVTTNSQRWNATCRKWLKFMTSAASRAAKNKSWWHGVEVQEIELSDEYDWMGV
jgi:hypothetical protein